jgi:rubredoxin
MVCKWAYRGAECRVKMGVFTTIIFSFVDLVCYCIPCQLREKKESKHK